ncbi:MAG: TonB-dependent receptor [Spartobacteria bacterium]
MISPPTIWNAGLSAAIIHLLAIAPAFGEETSSGPTTGGSVGTVEEVIVTGSNIPTSEEVGPNPVDTYRWDDIARLGVRSATDLTQKLPAAAGSAINENNVGNGDGRVEINLRGILAKETLVLQDGRRLASVGFAGDTVDLNTIPLGLIDHIDILKDGASAVYGADAVAGVFNVWLIHKFRGLELYDSYGNTNFGSANDAGEERGYLLAGTGDDKTDIVVYAEFYNRAALYSRDVHLSSDADFTRFGGTDKRSLNAAGLVAFIPAGFPFVYQPNLNGGALTPTPHAFPNVGSDPQYVPFFMLPREQQRFNFADLTPALPAVDREYFYGSIDRKICDQYLELFADFKYVRTFWDAPQAPVPFAPDVWTDATHPFGVSIRGISVPIQNPFNPFTVPDYTSPGGFDPRFPQSQPSAAPTGTQFTTNVLYRGLEAGLRTNKITTNNYEFTGGLKGNLGEFGDYLKTWNWETGFRYSADSRVQLLGGVVDTDALRSALLDTNPATAFNPFGLNQNSRAVIDKIFVNTHHLGRTSLTLENLKLFGDLFNLPAGPVSFAIGGEHRTEHASDQPDALISSGVALGFTDFASTQGSRDVWSICWEVRVPVTSPAWNLPGLHSLELDYQERFDDFSDFGATERPKFSVRWQPIDSALTIRATYSEAFHAPTLSDLFRGVEVGLALPVSDPRSPATPDGVATNLSGNPNLQPETAYEWTYGAVVTPGKWWSPLQGLTLQADFYHIDLRGVTVRLDPQFLIDHETQFQGQVLRGPSTGPNDPFGPIVLLLLPEQNLGRFIQEGWDYELAYSFESSRLGHGDWGTLTARFNGTYIDRVVLQGVVGGPEQSVVGKFGGGFLGTEGGGSFTHNRWYASLFYDGPARSGLGGLDTGFIVHYIGQYWDIYKLGAFDNKPRQPNDPNSHPIGFTDRKIREWITLDWVLNYTFNFAAPAAQNEVPGYAKDGGKNGKDKNVMPVSTAEYNPCGWRAWFNNTTITLGINNISDEQPPFVAASAENGYDESTANIKGRTWYLALKKRF